MHIVFTKLVNTVIGMVYIRPSAPIVSPTAIKPVGDSAHAPDQHALASDTIVNEFIVSPETERRRQQQDRRQQRKDALLETRAGRDRRKSNPAISITV